MAKKVYAPREYFVFYPPLPAFELHATSLLLENKWIAKYGQGGTFPRNATKELGKSKRLMQMAFYELALWCKRMELPFGLMFEIDLFLACMEDYANEHFPRTDVATESAYSMFSYLGVEEPTPEEIDRVMKKELFRLAIPMGRRDYPKEFSQPKNWTPKLLDQFFEMFPSEEVRLQLMHGICQARTSGFPFWTQELEEFFYPRINRVDFPEVNHILKQDDTGWKDGESWEETLKDEDEEDEP